MRKLIFSHENKLRRVLLLLETDLLPRLADMDIAWNITVTWVLLYFNINPCSLSGDVTGAHIWIDKLLQFNSIAWINYNHNKYILTCFICTKIIHPNYYIICVIHPLQARVLFFFVSPEFPVKYYIFFPYLRQINSFSFHS